ncbi:MAG: type III ribulose-bisphosphate carboxylase [Candidatus Aenigmatarchaeota archaeon]
MGYVDTSYKPRADDILVEFYVESNHCSLREAAEAIAAESSIGTWTDVSTMNARIRALGAKVYSIKKNGIIKIAYPIELFEKGNISQLMSSVAGNIFGMKCVKNLRLLDIHFPYSYLMYFKGPRLGKDGIRKMMKIYGRPLLGTIVKPKLGLSAKEHANVATNAWLGGLDIVKDDENLTSMRFNNFEERILKTLDALDYAQDIAGEQKAYMPNVTAQYDEMLKRAEYAIDHGSKYVMVDIISCGWSGVQQLCEDLKERVAIHAHRAGHAAFTKNPKHGISMLVIAKLARLVGVDQIHIGTVNIGKMVQTDDEQVMEDEIEDKIITNDDKKHILAQRWFHIKPTLAVASGGLHPGMIPELIEKMGNDVVLQFGGGCHGHPNGTLVGAMAIREAMNAVTSGIKLNDYAKYHSALKDALKKWK